MQKIKTIIRKEWADVFGNRLVLLTVLFIPLVFTVIPVGLLFLTRGGVRPPTQWWTGHRVPRPRCACCGVVDVAGSVVGVAYCVRDAGVVRAAVMKGLD